MSPDWASIFDNYGIKSVTPTDKLKGAYVPTAAQRSAMAAAGLQPSSGAVKAVHSLGVLSDPSLTTMQVSYYNSERVGSGRSPEPRIGQGLIPWISIGDTIVIGNVGGKVLVAKAGAANVSAQDTGRRLASEVDPATILFRAKKAKGKPAQRERKATDFVRNPWVVAGALSRGGGKCEMPGCATQLFTRDDNRPFLEVHHVMPLAEGGDDTLVNAAALCPMCHRELHHGKLRHKKRKTLETYIVSATPP
jgi:hypothetical protein